MKKFLIFSIVALSFSAIAQQQPCPSVSFTSVYIAGQSYPTVVDTSVASGMPGKLKKLSVIANNQVRLVELRCEYGNWRPVSILPPNTRIDSCGTETFTAYDLGGWTPATPDGRYYTPFWTQHKGQITFSAHSNGTYETVTMVCRLGVWQLVSVQ